jgi:cellulose synthase/poly-beta-1,6-N-acetylglucosamine synthase-like glycosyltransferase
VPYELIIVDNASEIPIDLTTNARHIRLDTRHTTGGARNAALEHVATEYVVFADADDEVAPDSLRKSLNDLTRHRRAAGVIGRSVVYEHGRPVRIGKRPKPAVYAIGRAVPGSDLALWLTGFRGSITSTVLRTQAVRTAGGFGDLDHGEDWILAARIARRRPFRWTTRTVRHYHRHPDASSYRDNRIRGRQVHRVVLADTAHALHAALRCSLKPRARALSSRDL